MGNVACLTGHLPMRMQRCRAVRVRWLAGAPERCACAACSTRRERWPLPARAAASCCCIALRSHCSWPSGGTPKTRKSAKALGRTVMHSGCHRAGLRPVPRCSMVAATASTVAGTWYLVPVLIKPLRPCQPGMWAATPRTCKGSSYMSIRCVR